MITITSFPIKGYARYIKKPAMVKAIQMPDKFEVKVKGNITYGNGGDWLVEYFSNELAIIDNIMFERIYRKMNDNE